MAFVARAGAFVPQEEGHLGAFPLKGQPCPLLAAPQGHSAPLLPVDEGCWCSPGHSRGCAAPGPAPPPASAAQGSSWRARHRQESSPCCRDGQSAEIQTILKLSEEFTQKKSLLSHAQLLRCSRSCRKPSIVLVSPAAVYKGKSSFIPNTVLRTI